MARASVGVSSYGALRGVEQFMEASCARQLNALNDAFAARFGYRFSANEAERSRTRQDQVWYNYLYVPGSPQAARPYTSTHDPKRAGAADIGVTRPDGSNRALSKVEHDWLVENGPTYGVIWTGKNFANGGEWWHFDVYPGRATIKPASSGATPIPEEQDDMYTDADRALAVEDRKALNQVKDDVAIIREAVLDGGSDSILTRLENAIGAIKLDAHATVEAVVYNDPELNAKRGQKSLVAIAKNVEDALLGTGSSIPEGNVVSMLRQLLGFIPKFIRPKK